MPGEKISSQLDVPAVILFDWFSKAQHSCESACVCVWGVGGGVRLLMHVLDREGSRVFASRALVVV